MKINNKNINRIHFNNTEIVLAKINGNIVFSQKKLFTATYDNNILNFTGLDGDYDFYYADVNGKVLKDYDKICNTKIYTYFNNLNKAPKEAETIVACDKNTINVKAIANIPQELKLKNLGNKLYSFGLLSDIHIDGDENDEAFSIQDFSKELQYFNNENVDFIAITGDLTYDGRLQDYKKYKEIIQSNAQNKIIIACTGNHDVLSEFSNWEEYVDSRGKYYEWTYNNDKFLILGLDKDDLSGQFITNEELNWLKEKLNQYRNQRVFLLFHVYIDPVGNVNHLYPYESLSGVIGDKFIDMLTHFKNVIFLSGHSHLDYRLQKFAKNANISIDNSTCHRIHTPSASRPRTNDEGISSSDTYNDLQGCEGAIVEVYENGLIIQGRDFEIDKNLPISRYYLETTIINVDEYVEENNTIKPIMEFGNIAYRTDGTLTDSTEYVRTADYIQVDPAKTYKISHDLGEINILCVFYDENKQFIKNWYFEDGTYYNYRYILNGGTITPPTNAKYMKNRITTTDLSIEVIIEEV